MHARLQEWGVVATLLQEVLDVYPLSEIVTPPELQEIVLEMQVGRAARTPALALALALAALLDAEGRAWAAHPRLPALYLRTSRSKS